MFVYRVKLFTSNNFMRFPHVFYNQAVFNQGMPRAHIYIYIYVYISIYIRPSMVIFMTTNVFHEQKRAYIYVLVL